MARHCFKVLAAGFLGLVGAGTSPLAQELAKDVAVVERIGKHFRIAFHAGSLPESLAGTLADQALATVEGSWPTLKKLLNAREREVGTIHLYRDEKDFRRVEAGNGLRFLMEAFNDKELTGHAWLWPPLPNPVLEVIGMPQTTVENLLRMAAEQVVAPLVPDTDVDHWFRHVVVMGAVEASTNPKHLSGFDAAHDRRRIVVKERRSEGTALSLDQLLNPKLTFQSRAEWDFAMTCCALMAQGLAAEDSRWASKLLGDHKLPRGPIDTFDRRRAAVMAVVGKEWSKAEIRFAAICRAMQPVWRTRSPLWVPGGKRSLLVGTVADAASVQAVEPTPAGDYAISGRVHLGPGAGGLRVTFGWDQKSVVAALLYVQEAQISVWDVATGKWLDKASFVPDAPWGVPFDFRVEVTAGEVRVSINGLQQLAWAHGGREVHNEWGLEVNDHLTWIENQRIEPLPPKKK